MQVQALPSPSILEFFQQLVRHVLAVEVDDGGADGTTDDKPLDAVPEAFEVLPDSLSPQVVELADDEEDHESKEQDLAGEPDRAEP